MIRFLFAVLLAFLSVQPALAHKLKVFATVEGDAVAGYAFFIGGGRAMGAKWTAVEGKGKTLAEGRTDDRGRFRLVPPQPVTAAVRITVDTEEGHIASAVLPVTRFGDATAAGPATKAATPAVPNVTPPDRSAPRAAAAPTGDPEVVARLVDAAVQRQVEPLLERIEAMDSRLRFTDILSGIFLIIGLAGMALWARGLRSGKSGKDPRSGDGEA